MPTSAIVRSSRRPPEGAGRRARLLALRFAPVRRHDLPCFPKPHAYTARGYRGNVRAGRASRNSCRVLDPAAPVWFHLRQPSWFDGRHDMARGGFHDGAVRRRSSCIAILGGIALVAARRRAVLVCRPGRIAQPRAAGSPRARAPMSASSRSPPEAAMRRRNRRLAGTLALAARGAPTACAQVSSAPLAQVDAWGVGWLGANEGALPATFWDNTDAGDARAPDRQPAAAGPLARRPAPLLRRVAAVAQQGSRRTATR